MREFFDSEDFDYEYYQMFIGNDDRILEKYKGSTKIVEIMKKVFRDIFCKDKINYREKIIKPEINCSVY